MLLSMTVQDGGFLKKFISLIESIMYLNRLWVVLTEVGVVIGLNHAINRCEDMMMCVSGTNFGGQPPKYVSKFIIPNR